MTLLSPDKFLSVAYAILRSAVEHRRDILVQTPTFIFNAIIAYLILCAAQFLWQLIRAAGDDQEAKRIAVEDLNAVLRPPLTAKAQKLYKKVQKRIEVGDEVFNHFNHDDYVGWSMHTQSLLLSWLTKSSPWFEEFRQAEKVVSAGALLAPEGPLLRQVAVLYRLIDEINRGRVFVRDAVLDDHSDGLASSK
jgi:hypothetical protein